MRRSWSRSLAITATVVLSFSGLTTAAAFDADPAATAGSTPGAVPRPLSSGQITLLTGDRVHLTTYSDGRAAATVDPAPRPNGATPGFHQQEVDGHLYVIPSDASRYLPDRLDPALFDVIALAEQNYDDAATDAIPVIVDYKRTAPARGEPARLPTFTPTTRLPAIGALAGDVDKAKAAGRGLALLSGDGMAAVDKIWLDQKAYADDEDSAPQIGAPSAWNAGYTGDGIQVAVLDTGIDTTHPDLQGKVVAAQNFSDSPDASDHFGHGSHVASILAGTGAASAGLRKGIAYDADLMNGKVLDDNGSGALSQVVEGMTWAATNGADVVNLSLGVRGLYTDGTDPLSQTVNQLTAEHGTLFVIAAGNDGSGDGTVTTPGTADSALTVGAVDDNDVLAAFSSRGPRAGDFALKPDVTAPGVDIIAARAAGTSMGTPVDENYTAASGTSMATPHVAGAAAVLAQQRPDLTGQELKALLMSSAAPQDASVYEQGAGRVDLTHAIAPTVLPGTGSLSMGYFPYPQTDATPVTRTLTYRNLGDQDVTLTIDHDVANEDGNAPADGMLTVDADTLIVPAAGTADLTVTVDPKVGDFGLYGGYVTATDAAGTVTRTTVGFYKESERYNLTVNGITRDGRSAGGISMVDVLNVDDRGQFLQSSVGFSDGKATFRLPPGRYAAMSFIFAYDEPNVYAIEAAAVSEPEFEITGDTEITLDARAANPIEIGTERPSEPASTALAYYREAAAGGSFSHSFHLSPPISTMYATPTDAVDTGEFEFYSKWELLAPDLTLTADGQPLDVEYVFDSAKLDGSFDTELVYAKLGRPEDFAAVDVKGKIAVIQRGQLTFREKMNNAKAAGARAAIMYNDRPGLMLIGGDPQTVPTLAMSQADGEALVDRMGGAPLPVHVEAVARSPYQYEVLFAEPDRVPEDLAYEVTDDNSVTIHNRYRSHVPDHGVGELRHKWRPWESFSVGFLRRTTAPFERTEYVSAGDTRWAQYFYGDSLAGHPFDFPFQDEPTTFKAGSTLQDSWLSQVTVPEFWPSEGDSARREGQTMSLSIPEWGDREDHWGFRAPGDSTTFRLYEDGSLVGESDRATGDFAVGTDAATYRLELDVARQAEWWTMSTQTSSVWTAHSAAPNGSPEALPLLQADYRVDGLDLLNRTRRAHTVTLSVDHQLGADAGRITDADLEISVDDGASWQPVTIHQRGPGTYVAPIAHLPRGAEYVSLRLDVRDADGNRLQQEVTRAYSVR